MPSRSGFVYWFKEVDKDDRDIVGSKGANLGEMVRAGFPVPNGFIVSSKAYFHFIRENNLAIKIKHLLASANFDRPESLLQVSEHIQREILHGEIPEPLIKDIFSYYHSLGGIFSDALVTVRSSTTAEDLPTASFASQQETSLNIQGETSLLLKIKEVWASLFDARALSYRHEKKLDHFRIGVAVVVQQMVESEKSGVMFTIDPVTNDKTKIVIEAVYGLGELIVEGLVTPDHYEIDKKTMDIILKQTHTQEKMLKKVGRLNKEVKLTLKEGGQQKISEKHILELAELGKKLEHHYFFPQDIEWALVKSKVYIVQTRAITTVHNGDHSAEKQQLPLVLSGVSASPGIVTGPARVIHSVHDLSKVMPGEVIVTSQTTKDYFPAMKKAAAVVIEQSGHTSHAAVVSRERGIPAVMGAEKATKLIKSGNVYTVDGTKGHIFAGGIASSSVSSPRQIHTEFIKTATKVYIDVADPQQTEAMAARTVDGVGLLRAEFLMETIGVHPKKLIRDDKEHVFIDKMAEQVAQICQAFDSRPVIYRTSDFKTTEYRKLIGGKDFEPIEPNPLLGYRGAFRYIHDPEVFKMELEVIKRVREKRELKNLWLMIPFVRTVKELVAVKKIINEADLQRSPTFKLFMMVEIPANVILLEEFIKVGIDGVSIGSDDLTTLILGTDRNNSEVSSEYNEQNEAVLWALEHIIKMCHKHDIISSICGQAPSLYPDLLEKLVHFGISSVCVSPDVSDSVRKHIAAIEKRM